MKIRERVSNVFNLGREDYQSDEEYNQFLEEKEELSKVDMGVDSLYSTNFSQRYSEGKRNGIWTLERV